MWIDTFLYQFIDFFNDKSRMVEEVWGCHLVFKSSPWYSMPKFFLQLEFFFLTKMKFFIEKRPKLKNYKLQTPQREEEKQKSCNEKIKAF